MYEDLLLNTKRNLVCWMWLDDSFHRAAFSGCDSILALDVWCGLGYV